MSTAQLDILLIEDSAADEDLIRHALRSFGVGLRMQRVADEVAMRTRLAGTLPDAVLSDFSMPGFSGRDALRICREMAPEVPFIFVSGTIGEELAIDALQRGAADYVLKDNLVRLPAAIDRAIRAAGERRGRVAAERALQASEERFRALVESTDDWIWEIAADGRIAYANPAVERILGYRPDELIGGNALDLMAANERDTVAEKLGDAMRAGIGWRNWVISWRHRDGSERRLQSSAQPVFDGDGRLVGMRGIDRDVTEWIAQKNRIRQLARIHAVLGALGNAILRATEPHQLLAMACDLAIREGGFLAATVVEADADTGGTRVVASAGENALTKMVGAAVESGEDARSAALRSMRRGRAEVVQALATQPHAESNEMYAFGACAKVALPLGTPPWGALVLHSPEVGAFDAEEMALLARLAADLEHGLDFLGKSERLEFLAYHNTITGLPNRTAFSALIEARVERRSQTVALFDAVSFHVFNDSRGREFSEDLLRAISVRLREHFGSEALVAHLGEDAFALCIGESGSVDSAVAQMGAFLEEFSRQPFSVQGERVYVDLRCGLLQAPLHGSDADTIERNVMSALSEARNTGIRLVVYDEAFSARAQKRVDIERELRVAVEKLQFELFLQPKFAARTQTLTGAEALLRWRHPQRGLISPLDFIPLLEETGLILPVGRWVMQEAIKIAARWRRHGHSGLRLAINLSARELRDEGFLRDSGVLLQQAGAEHGIDVEITESLVMDDISRSIRILQGLRELGCQVAIDDFGTGYSSLNYLSRLPADILKIDRSFVADISQSPESLALVTNTIGLAHALGLRVVAEGVEEEEQAKLLRLLRCDEVQGYLFGRPQPVADFEKQYIS